MQEPYNIYYVVNYGFCYVPLWLQQAINKGLVKCNHPQVVQDIWDLSYSYKGTPSLTIIKTNKEFCMNGTPITYEDVYGDNDGTRLQY